jgi:hypothetical protein
MKNTKIIVRNEAKARKLRDLFMDEDQVIILDTDIEIWAQDHPLYLCIAGRPNKVRSLREVIEERRQVAVDYAKTHLPQEVFELLGLHTD